MIRYSEESRQLDTLFEERFPAVAVLDEQTWFVDAGSVDSFMILKLINELEQCFSIRIEDHEMSEENLGCKAGLRVFLAAKLAGKREL